jgi:hypothetical protein
MYSDPSEIRKQRKGRCKHGLSSADVCALCQGEWIKEEQKRVNKELKAMGADEEEIMDGEYKCSKCEKPISAKAIRGLKGKKRRKRHPSR